MTKAVLFLLVIPLLLGACGLVGAAPGAAGVQVVQEAVLTRAESSLPDPVVRRGSQDGIALLEPTLTPLPSATPVPTGVLPTETPTVVIPPTATPPFPLSIDYLRVQEYPPSELVIEQVLEPGANYQRYIASYRSEGLRINALLTVPDGEMPATGWPVIVFNHGYIPPDEYRTTERYVDYVDGFARRGYIVLRSDYRGHADSEGEARGAYGYPDYTIDVLNAVAAVKVFPQADPDRIGMWGHSMGGYITLRAMVTTNDIKAGVIWAGVVASYEDLLTRWRRSGPTPTPDGTPSPRRWRDQLSQQFGSPEENPGFWASISANSYLQDLSGPLQLHHATGDTTVPVEFSTTLAAQVREIGGIVEYYIYDGDNHNLSVNFSEAMLRSIYFFDLYVKGE